MEFRNLGINILYHMGCVHEGRERAGFALRRDVLEEFSDIPESVFMSVVNELVADGLISTNSSCTRLWITANGNRKLQSVVARHKLSSDHCFFGIS